MDENYQVVPLDAWSQIRYQVKFDVNAYVVPIEDLRPGMTVATAQLFEPHPDKVYAKARLGLSDRGIAASFWARPETIRRHFSKTIDRARADRAAELLELMGQKVQNEDLFIDKDALNFLMKRLDKEDTTPQPLVNITLPPQLSTITVDQLNDQLTSDD